MTLPPVLYIGGCSRSGSTLLARLLDAIPGVFSPGEMAHYWLRGILEAQLCGCGLPVPQCPVWSRVQAQLPSVPAAAEIVRLQHRWDRFRRSRAILRESRAESRDEGLMTLARAYADHVQAAAAISGATVIVDSSKRLPRALIMAATAHMDCRVVHLVRDPRAVAYSRTRFRARPEITGGQALMGRRPPIRSAIEWVVVNRAFARNRLHFAAYKLVRYEDVIREPTRVLMDILHFAGVTATPGMLEFLSRSDAIEGTTHSISGNPMRFAPIKLPLAEDIAWRTEMAPINIRLIEMVAGSLMEEFGYV